MIAYFLRGVEDDHILVFRSADPEEILRIITRLGASRDKEIKALAKELEINWYEREYQNTKKESKTNKNGSRRVSRKVRPEDRKASENRSGN